MTEETYTKSDFAQSSRCQGREAEKIDSLVEIMPKVLMRRAMKGDEAERRGLS